MDKGMEQTVTTLTDLASVLLAIGSRCTDEETSEELSEVADAILNAIKGART